jgi:hypothetical protein
MMRSETVLEFLSINAFGFFMSFNISIPPVCSRSDQLMRSKQNFLLVVALDNL